MPNNLYRIYNGPMPTTGAQQYVTTGTAIKTMLQLKSSSPFTVTNWGYALETAPTAALKVELLTTGTINATVTASVAADVVKWSDPSGAAADLTYATSGTGYTSGGAEGSIVATRIMDVGDCTASSYRTQYPLARDASVAALDICRIRVLTTAAVNMLCWIEFEQKR